MERRDFIRKTGLTSMAGIGAASLGLQSFAPATEERPETKMNVLDFGAKGDGKTSDTEAIQKALDEAGKVNGTVWFPAGIYRCHELKVPPYVTLLGDPCWIYHWTARMLLVCWILQEPLLRESVAWCSTVFQKQRNPSTESF